MKLSIILPLFDLRDASEKPLASLLNQRLERTRYEVVVLVPRRDKQALVGREPFASLVAQCDQVVCVDADPAAPDSEIVFYEEGSRKATGDLLFFVEGHTIILPGACSAIYDHFSANPRCVAAWGRRVNHNLETLGKLIGMHNTSHETAAKAQGCFTLGANSIIRKSVLMELGGFDPSYGRFNETILFDKLLKQGSSIDNLDVPLAVHYNDMSVGHLAELAVAMGTWRARYLLDSGGRRQMQSRAGLAVQDPPGKGPQFAPHGLAWLVQSRASARVGRPLFTAMGVALLQVAKLLYDVNARLAYRTFVSALGFFDLSGYTQVRLRRGAD